MTPFELYKQNIKRMNNLVKNSEYDGEVKEALLIETEEIKLWNIFKLYEPFFDSFYKRNLYSECFQVFICMQHELVMFLDNVKINTNVESLKYNRIALIKKILSKMNSISDFTK